MNTVRVSWYDCDCEWLLKYCDDYHRTYASVPVKVLEKYREKRARDE